jgi:predicted N-formylglutamate amidohydrolase
MIEIRNDLITDQASQRAMAERLARFVEGATVALADMIAMTDRAGIAQ